MSGKIDTSKMLNWQNVKEATYKGIKIVIRSHNIRFYCYVSGKCIGDWSTLAVAKSQGVKHIDKITCSIDK